MALKRHLRECAPGRNRFEVFVFGFDFNIDVGRWPPRDFSDFAVDGAAAQDRTHCLTVCRFEVDPRDPDRRVRSPLHRLAISPMEAVFFAWAASG